LSVRGAIRSPETVPIHEWCPASTRVNRTFTPVRCGHPELPLRVVGRADEPAAAVMMVAMTWLLVILAGAAGTAARYSIGLAVGAREFPWATLGINVAGSFLIGLVLTAGTLGRLHPQTTAALAVGFLGAFTTYSTFAWEALVLGRTNQVALGVLYVLLSVLLGLLAAALGYRLGQTFGTH
jgi:fluoride exporter